MNRYIIIKMVSLYEQAKTGTLTDGDRLKKKNSNIRRTVNAIEKLSENLYRISFTDNEGISVTPTIEEEWEKEQDIHHGGKNKRKSRRNKKTKRRKSHRHR